MGVCDGGGKIDDEKCDGDDKNNSNNIRTIVDVETYLHNDDDNDDARCGVAIKSHRIASPINLQNIQDYSVDTVNDKDILIDSPKFKYHIGLKHPGNQVYRDTVQ